MILYHILQKRGKAYIVDTSSTGKNQAKKLATYKQTDKIYMAF